MPLVYAGATGVDEPVTEAHERARKIKPQYTEGELVRVAERPHQAEAEFIQGLLLEEGVPSMLRRSRGFDVPDMLAAGPRDVIVPALGRRRRARRAAAGRPPRHPSPGPPVERPGRLLGVLLGVVVARRRHRLDRHRVAHVGDAARRLGDSDLEVSAIALGSWLTYSGGVGRARTEACTRAAFEAGITLLRHRQRLRARRRRARLGRDPRRLPARLVRDRDQALLPDVGERPRALAPRRSTSRSTARSSACGMDHVDLYQCHRYDEQTPLEETMQALTEVVQAGKARWIGFSEWPVERIERGPGAARGGEVRLQPAAVLGAVARARGRGHPAVRAQRHLADRVVAARPGRAHRQVPRRRGRRRRARAPPRAT